MTLNFISRLFRRAQRPVAERAERTKDSSDAALGLDDYADRSRILDKPKSVSEQRVDWLVNFALGGASVLIGFAIHGCVAARH